MSGIGRLAPAGMASPAVYQGARPVRAEPAPSVALLRQFPPRPVPAAWPLTGQPGPRVIERLLAPPFAAESRHLQQDRRRGLIRVLRWLEQQPGDTWQDRWMASGADAAGNAAWRGLLAGWLASTGQGPADPDHVSLMAGRAIMLVVCADVIRPSLGWLLTPATAAGLAAEMARTRDPGGFAALAAICQANCVNSHTTQLAQRRIATILAAKGGLIADITVGDCLELLRVVEDLQHSNGASSPYFYQLLRAAGVLADGMPPARALRTQGQLSCEQLIDRYDIQCRPVRDLLVDYLRERQPAVDYATVHKLSYVLGRLFWRDLELHHPGIGSLHLPASVAAAWKQRITTKTTRSRDPGGQIVEVTAARVNALDHLVTVRAFYLDLTQWAADDPARWGPWVVPCPVRAADVTQIGKARSRRKARMDQRTRERMPVLPALLAAVDGERRAAAERLRTAQGTPPGELLTAAGQTLRRSARPHASAGRIWADDPETRQRRDLTLEEHRSFWTWAAVEVLRHTGVRIEELTELSHHSFIQYQLPATGELIPLLQIAPSKTDTERLLVIGPELADVLSVIICRIRGEDGAVPLVLAYDYHERLWNPPMPLLFQRRYGGEDRPIGGPAVRELINDALASTGLTDASGRPLRFVPHDFRRIFVTDAIMHGMPPHIAQLVAGHRDINVTMGYKAVYPEEVINGHRAFIARRRSLRPAGEYRTPTEEEWTEFLGHFERRRLSLGTCGRSYATPCIHEHSCIRCPLLRPDPAQRPRLTEIHANLLTRIEEAHREGWAGEAEGLKVSLAAARQKLAQMSEISARHRDTAVHLGMPAHPGARQPDHHRPRPSRQGTFMTPAAITPGLLHQLTAGSHAEGITALDVAAAICHDTRILLIAEDGTDFTDSTWQLPAGPVLPGHTLTDALHPAVAAIGLTIDEVTGYLGHDDQADSVITRTFCFTVTVTDPDAICRTAGLGHYWADIDNLAQYPDLLAWHPAGQTAGMTPANTQPVTEPPLAGLLRAWASGIYPDEAACDLLINQATWLARSDFQDRFTHLGTSPGGTELASIDWPAAVAALNEGSLPCSGGEERILRLAASLGDGLPVNLRDASTGIDTRNAGLLIQAVLHANGHRPAASLRQPRT